VHPLCALCVKYISRKERKDFKYKERKENIINRLILSFTIPVINRLYSFAGFVCTRFAPFA